MGHILTIWLILCSILATSAQILHNTDLKLIKRVGVRTESVYTYTTKKSSQLVQKINYDTSRNMLCKRQYFKQGQVEVRTEFSYSYQHDTCIVTAVEFDNNQPFQIFISKHPLR